MCNAFTEQAILYAVANVSGYDEVNDILSDNKEFLDIDFSDDTYDFRFEKGENVTHVLYTAGESHKRTLYTNSPLVVTDLMGTKKILVPTEGKITIKVTL